jgi:RHS repeat-associated protein
MGNLYSFFHDGSGRVTEVMFPRIGTLRLTYDAAGRVSSATYPWAGIIRFEYTPSGLIKMKTNARGQVCRFEYDSLGRLVEKTTPRATCSYTYDQDGNLTRAKNEELTIEYTYDATGRLSRTDYVEWGKSIDYGYDELGRLNSLTGPGGSRIGYVYDKIGRVSRVSASAGCVFEFSYDNAGRLQQRSCSNGVSTRYGYDVEGRVKSIHHTDSIGKTLAKRLYTYDLEGNRSEVIDEKVGRTSYLYDEEGRMTSEDNAGGWNKYVFGPGGNRVWVSRMSGSDTYGYDDWGRLIKSNEQALGYDLDGNLSRRREGSATTRYFYDSEHNLTRVELPGGRVVEYGYGPLGRRIWREENGSRIYLLNDGFNVFQELREDLEPKSTYSYAGYDNPLAALSSNGQVVFFHQDVLGSLIAVSDSNGRLLARYIYDAFGKVVEEVWQQLEYPPRFAGRPLDPRTGLYDMRSRHYDPDVGLYTGPNRWLGSIDDPATLAPYVYARHNPLRYVEPTGYLAVEAQLQAGPPRSWTESTFVTSFTQNPSRNHISAQRLASTPGSTVRGNLMKTVTRCFGRHLSSGGYNPDEWKLRDDSYVALLANAQRALDLALCTGGIFESRNCGGDVPAELGLRTMVSRLLPWQWGMQSRSTEYGMRSKKLSPVIDERLPVSGIPAWEQRSYALAMDMQNTLRQHYAGALTHVAEKVVELKSLSDATKDAANEIDKSESRLADERKDAAKKLDKVLKHASDLQETRAKKYREIQELEEQDPEKRKERTRNILISLLKEAGEKIEDMQSELEDISEIKQEAQSQLAIAAERAPEVAPALELRREILGRLDVLKGFEGQEGEATRLEDDVLDINLGPTLGHDPVARVGALMNDIVNISERAAAVPVETSESYDEIRAELDSLDH